VRLLGERGYLVLYSLIALATLSYLIWLYDVLPRYEYFWMPSPLAYQVAKLIMPISLILALGGFLMMNPASVAVKTDMARTLGESGTTELARGVTRITRHPFQWGVLLWAIAHLIANGDTISVVFFSTFALLASVGPFLIDRKKAAQLGSHWQDYEDATSNVPFLAIIQGRNSLKLRELWLPLLIGMLAYGILLWRHEWVSGVRIF
jgi:uncharacterized membrane protein